MTLHLYAKGIIMHKITKLLFTTLTVFFLVACGSGNDGSIAGNLDNKQDEAIETIATYAQDSTVQPTVQDYIDAGVSGVTNTNLTDINNEITALNYENINERAEIQAVVDGMIQGTTVVDENGSEVVCAQVITHAYNPTTQEEKDFPTPCDVPEGWIVGTPTVVDENGSNLDQNGSEVVCTQVITHAYNPATLEERDFPTPCAVLDGWVVAEHPPKTVQHYGEEGTHAVSTYVEQAHGNATVYYPSDINTTHKTPLVFFDPGYGSTDPTEYDSLLRFIASHGISVIYAKQAWLSEINYYEKILDDTNDVLPYVDTTRIGVIGHSLGGGNAFKVLDHFTKKGYGSNGRFIMAIEPWYAFGMDSIDMTTLPANTNVIIQQYGIGGNNSVNDTDARIPLSEYYMLDSIAKKKKDYQVYKNADHHYPYGTRDYTQMQHILKPLDALMQYTFYGIDDAHPFALEVGNDDPYNNGNGIQVVNPTESYHYKCADNHTLTIDYCDMAQWYSKKQLILHQKGHWLPSMSGNFASRADYINTLPFSGYTMVGNSYTNRVMESNTTLLPYSYIWDEVKAVKDLYPTKSNFLAVHMHYPGDFWDDAVWNNVIANFKTLAKVAKDLGFRGILYDDEAYDVESHKMINYDKGEWYDDTAYKNPNKTFVEHSAKITSRFKQIMEAMVSEYNAIDVLYYHSPVEGHIEANHGIDGHPVVVNVGLERQHEWMGAMFLGLKQGLSPQATLHDMGEDYRLRTQKHFDDAYTWRKHTIASDATNDAVDATQHWVIPQAERATWAKDVHVDFMVSNEPLASEAYPEFDTTNTVELDDMKTTLERALDKSDKYVTYYSASSSDNKGGLIQLDWLNDPATHADDGSAYGLEPAWKAMVQDVYNTKVLK